MAFLFFISGFKYRRQIINRNQGPESRLIFENHSVIWGAPQNSFVFQVDDNYSNVITQQINSSA